jgi:hypothetical protein
MPGVVRARMRGIGCEYGDAAVEEATRDPAGTIG